MMDVDAEALGRGDEEIGVGLGIAHLIAGHHRHLSRIDAQHLDQPGRRLHPPAGGDGPGHLLLGQGRQQLAGAGQGHDGSAMPTEGFGMALAQALDQLGRDWPAHLAQQRIGEEPAAHADPAMDAPDGEGDPGRLEGLMPRQHMLVDAVDQGAVEIEEKGEPGLWRSVGGRSGAVWALLALAMEWSSREDGPARRVKA
jgi:hypothetical protein